MPSKFGVQPAVELYRPICLNDAVAAVEQKSPMFVGIVEYRIIVAVLGAHVGLAVEMYRVDPDESACFALFFDEFGPGEKVVFFAEKHFDAAHLDAVFFAPGDGNRIVCRYARTTPADRRRTGRAGGCPSRERTP